MKLLIIRHGDPDYTTDSLTEKGLIQAEAVGKRMFDAGIDRIFSSPMGRASMSARSKKLEKAKSQMANEYSYCKHYYDA